MQGVGFERFALVLARDSREHSRAKQIHQHGDGESADGEPARLDLHGVKEEPLDRLPDDVEGGDHQQARFDKRRKTFDFAVAVRVAGVGREIGDANGQIGENRSDEVEAGMHRLGEHAEAVRGDGEHDLDEHQHDRRANRTKRGHLLGGPAG